MSLGQEIQGLARRGKVNVPAAARSAAEVDMAAVLDDEAGAGEVGQGFEALRVPEVAEALEAAEEAAEADEPAGAAPRKTVGRKSKRARRR